MDNRALAVLTGVTLLGVLAIMALTPSEVKPIQTRAAKQVLAPAVNDELTASR